jgi:hypothetical protein
MQLGLTNTMLSRAKCKGLGVLNEVVEAGMRESRRLPHL